MGILLTVFIDDYNNCIDYFLMFLILNVTPKLIPITSLMTLSGALIQLSGESAKFVTNVFASLL